jgi:hypothetical protein
MREFVRHPSDIPVAVKVAMEAGSRRGYLRDVSIAGLSCDVARIIDVGSRIEFFVPSLAEESVGRGRVVWCRPLRASYRMGVEFECEQDAYRTKMVEQVCQIESYRREVQEMEGRELGAEEAAAEWIESHAAEFDRRFS